MAQNELDELKIKGLLIQRLLIVCLIGCAVHLVHHRKNDDHHHLFTHSLQKSLGNPHQLQALNLQLGIWAVAGRARLVRLHPMELPPARAKA